MRYRRMRFFLAVAALGPAGCAVGPRGGWPPRTALPSTDGGSTPMATAIPNGVSRKRVNGKEEPSTLIALDRTRCTVTDDRFKAIKIGDDVTCTWGASDRAP